MKLKLTVFPQGRILQEQGVPSWCRGDRRVVEVMKVDLLVVHNRCSSACQREDAEHQVVNDERVVQVDNVDIFQG